jgi:hypothetical protein
MFATMPKNVSPYYRNCTLFKITKIPMTSKHDTYIFFKWTFLADIITIISDGLLTSSLKNATHMYLENICFFLW